MRPLRPLTSLPRCLFQRKTRIATLSGGLKHPKHSVFYYLCIPLVLIFDCLACVCCAESAGGAEAVSATASRHHGKKSWISRTFPACIAHRFQAVGLGRDMHYWDRLGTTHRHHIQKLLVSMHASLVPLRVYHLDCCL
jgi:hypothetical protein